MGLQRVDTTERLTYNTHTHTYIYIYIHITGQGMMEREEPKKEII